MPLLDKAHPELKKSLETQKRFWEVNIAKLLLNQYTDHQNVTKVNRRYSRNERLLDSRKQWSKCRVARKSKCHGPPVRWRARLERLRAFFARKFDIIVNFPKKYSYANFGRNWWTVKQMLSSKSAPATWSICLVRNFRQIWTALKTFPTYLDSVKTTSQTAISIFMYPFSSEL